MLLERSRDGILYVTRDREKTQQRKNQKQEEEEEEANNEKIKCGKCKMYDLV